MTVHSVVGRTSPPSPVCDATAGLAPPFPQEEYRARLRKVRRKMTSRELDAVLVTAPENIYYLTGLDHQGFFAFHMLIVPRQGELWLVAREMERATIEEMVPHVRFVGYPDHRDRALAASNAIKRAGLSTGRLGIERHSLYFPPRTYERIITKLRAARWIDASRLVEDVRLIKSPLEIAYTRHAARVSDAMMNAAIETAKAGVNETEVAAEVYRAMTLAGGENPGFGPFIRPSPRLHQEHTTWRNRTLQQGEAVFLEMAGCVHRYHAPMGRFIFLGGAPEGTEAIEAVCLEAFDAIVKAIRPGVTAHEVYRTWQERVDAAGLSHYRRHHCGYVVGLGFPPSWTGGSMVVGLRRNSRLRLRPGMVFHLLSWLVGTGRGDYFISNTAVLNDQGCEVLTATPLEVQVV